MSQTRILKSPLRYWSCTPEIRLVTPWPHVSPSSVSDSVTLNIYSPEIFDEYTRRQYVAKAPSRNPFGVEEEPQKFDGFDVFTKIRVLVQLSQWTLINPDRIKERMPDTKDGDQVGWVSNLFLQPHRR